MRPRSRIEPEELPLRFHSPGFLLILRLEPGEVPALALCVGQPHDNRQRLRRVLAGLFESLESVPVRVGIGHHHNCVNLIGRAGQNTNGSQSVLGVWVKWLHPAEANDQTEIV